MEIFLKKIQETCEFIKAQSSLQPKVSVVLGSGLGCLPHWVEVDWEVPYSQIPHFFTPCVEGHEGSLALGRIQGVPLFLFRGRVHYYEGYSMEEVVYYTRVLSHLGVSVLMLTNSSGGLKSQMRPGDFMVIEDHINLTNTNPLRGPNLDSLGPRFPDMSEVYDKSLRESMVEVLKKLKIPHWKGVYCGVSGPSYETPAEIQFLKTIGAHAVGMSTVAESISAHHLGLRVCGLSCITNLGAGISQEKLTHQDVREKARSASDGFWLFLNEFFLLEEKSFS